MLMRNGFLLGTWAIATSLATKIGELHVASHQVVLSLWLLCALVSEAPAISAQVLAARYFSNGQIDKLKSLIKRLAMIGVVISSISVFGFVVSRKLVASCFTDDPQLYEYISKLLIIVAFQMPLVSYTLMGEGILIGCQYFRFMGISSVITSLITYSSMKLFLIFSKSPSIFDIWKGITVLFLSRLTFVLMALSNKKYGPLKVKEAKESRALPLAENI